MLEETFLEASDELVRASLNLTVAIPMKVTEAAEKVEKAVEEYRSVLLDYMTSVRTERKLKEEDGALLKIKPLKEWDNKWPSELYLYYIGDDYEDAVTHLKKGNTYWCTRDNANLDCVFVNLDQRRPISYFMSLEDVK